jgi:hypothetical protein
VKLLADHMADADGLSQIVARQFRPDLLDKERQSVEELVGTTAYFIRVISRYVNYSMN